MKFFFFLGINLPISENHIEPQLIQNLAASDPIHGEVLPMFISLFTRFKLNTLFKGNRVLSTWSNKSVFMKYFRYESTIPINHFPIKEAGIGFTYKADGTGGIFLLFV